MRRHKSFNQGVTIQRRLSEILIKKSKDPRFAKVTVTRVESDHDSSFAKVYVATFPPEGIEALIESLNRAAGFFSANLGKVLKTRHTPKLLFVYDRGFDYSTEIEEVMKKVSFSESQEDLLS